MKTITKKINLINLPLYIKTLKADYKIKSDEELCNLIYEHFNVLCTIEDLEEFNMQQEHLIDVFHMHEDFELENRKQIFNLNFE